MPIIEFQHVSYRYGRGSLDERQALNDITFAVEPGEFIGIVGSNGSGKSTLVQHINGLLCPDEGYVTVLGKKTSDRQHRNGLWRKVGLLFQYPEQQLFEATVIDDVAYGLRNMGMKQADAAARAREALSLVGLNPDEVGAVPPLSLSGGQRRRAAIAGVLAMKPDILILDEATAGLDGPGKTDILSLVKRLQQEMGMTVLMISHSMREVMALADKIAVLADGRLAAWGSTRDVMREEMMSSSPGLFFSEYALVLIKLAELGYPVNTGVRSREEALEELLTLIGRKGHERREARAVHAGRYGHPQA
ncbi:ATP-binding cassette domain-containing protein [Paenibacillus durus]|uniref:ATP-binding cassette domain-containing protein n=1 Tax=Paenibacillus durus TaxID=44251 RepID=UPI0005A94D52|nr:ATP-binding cassette domain-containing protein [Paenibacillus durus]